jgi:tol-pal system protein YbgF
MNQTSSKQKIFKPLICLLYLFTTACGTAKFDALQKRIDADLADLRQIQAQQTATISEIRTEVRQLSGQVEELQYVSQGKAKELERTLRQLGTRVPPPSGVPGDLLTKDEERIASLQGEAADSFKSALNLLRTGDFSTSLDRFTQFIADNPGTAFTDNALFWQGINYVKLGQYDQGIISFSDVFQTYPAEDMVAPALFFLADAFKKKGETEDAKITLKKLIEEHPKSSYARKAKVELKQLSRRRR